MRNMSGIMLLLLSGCAANSAQLGRAPMKLSIDSAKTPQQFALCAAETINGNSPLRNEGDDHYWLVRLNGYDMPAVRWDFVKTPTGSRAELRTAIGINNGTGKVKACA